ncbi:Hsp20/alpha crystallin family protein [Oceanispirochaeta sp.]|uniref:Hsp20/alpha crystallin family protein n=1 Tax=Oceanispirochaeta sp. TaxID=2035350 RepID=UPI0026090359|nr:Hsp20/alpha crystallin family protein [Oceanispirochaeta sp.]MDA3958731.1 Hsp20/alpha crystallin family protein [Oceanispirochaeta sp.]
MNNIVVRRNPAPAVNAWKGLNRMFNDENSAFEAEPRKPVVHVENEESRVVLTAELPGFGSDDLDIQVNENLLTIKALKKGDKKEEEIVVFERSFVLPEDLKREDIQAEMKNGLLTLDLPRKEKPAPLAIKVKG